VQQSKEKLNVIENSVADKEETLEDLTAQIEDIEQIEARADEIHRMGRKNDNGYIEMTENSSYKLITLARNELYARRNIETLQSQIGDLQEKLGLAMGKLEELYQSTKDYVIALRFAPGRIKSVVSDIIATNKIKAELIRNKPMPPLFQGWKSKQRNDIDIERGREQ
jgi:DNA repair ATPase RecN